MVFEHQTQMTNLITRVAWQARIAGQGSPALAIDLDDLVAYMLFTHEARLVEPIEGVSSFARTFASRGRADRRGRSLRELDLTTRLFRYPLSYLIGGRAFAALPAEVREAILRRLHAALTRSGRAGRASDPGGSTRDHRDRRRNRARHADLVALTSDDTRRRRPRIQWQSPASIEMTMRRFPLSAAVLAALVIVLPPAASAQLKRIPAEIVPIVDSDGVRAGTTVRAALQVTLPEGFHVQSNRPRDPSLIATELTVDSVAGIEATEVVFPKAIDFHAGGPARAAAGVRAPVHGRRAVGDCRRRPALGWSTLPARLRYQACDNKVCFAPATAQTSWTLRVVPATARGHAAAGRDLRRHRLRHRGRPTAVDRAAAPSVVGTPRAAADRRAPGCASSSDSPSSRRPAAIRAPATS